MHGSEGDGHLIVPLLRRHLPSATALSRLLRECSKPPLSLNVLNTIGRSSRAAPNASSGRTDGADRDLRPSGDDHLRTRRTPSRPASRTKRAVWSNPTCQPVCAIACHMLRTPSLRRYASAPVVSTTTSRIWAPRSRFFTSVLSTVLDSLASMPTAQPAGPWTIRSTSRFPRWVRRCDTLASMVWASTRTHSVARLSNSAPTSVPWARMVRPAPSSRSEESTLSSRAVSAGSARWCLGAAVRRWSGEPPGPQAGPTAAGRPARFREDSIVNFVTILYTVS